MTGQSVKKAANLALVVQRVCQNHSELIKTNSDCPVMPSSKTLAIMKFAAKDGSLIKMANLVQKMVESF